MSSHGNPTLRLPGAAVAGQVVTVADCAGSEVWHSHPLAAGRDAVCVDVRDGRFVGVGGGWSVLPPGGYTVAIPAAAATDARPLAPPPGRRAVAPAGGRIEVAAELRVTARFGAEEGGWLPRDAAWHSDGTWRLQGGTDPGIVAVAVEAAAGTRPAGPPGGGSRGACAYLFVDAAMHGAVGARFTAPGAGSAAVWGLIARHYNDGNHLRLTLQRDGAGLLLRLERRAAAADPGCRRRILAAAHVTLGGAPRGELRWHFNGTRHEVALDGVVRLTAADGYMGGVEIVGLFAEPDLAGSAPVWHSFSVVSSQWVPRHEVRRGAYAAVVRPGNIHRLHLSPAPGRQPATLDPRTNLFWESGLQVGHIGGSEIKFTQGAALDLLARGPVADLVRWRGPMPRFVDQDADLRGYARGSAVFYDDRIVVGDWVAVRVRRSVGPDFDLLARALTGPARFAAGAERTFRPWKLPAGAAMATLAAGPCRELYPVALAFPLRIGSAAWHLIAAVGGLCNVGGAAPGRAFGWRCPRRLTASHDLRVAPTVPGTEYGFWDRLHLAVYRRHRRRRSGRAPPARRVPAAGAPQPAPRHPGALGCDAGATGGAAGAGGLLRPQQRRLSAAGRGRGGVLHLRSGSDPPAPAGVSGGWFGSRRARRGCLHRGRQAAQVRNRLPVAGVANRRGRRAGPAPARRDGSPDAGVAAVRLRCDPALSGHRSAGRAGRLFLLRRRRDLRRSNRATAQLGCSGSTPGTQRRPSRRQFVHTRPHQYHRANDHRSGRHRAPAQHAVHGEQRPH